MDHIKLTKSELFIRQTINAVLLAGIIIFFIGVYYFVIKAGIPYQDPPLELQIQYTVNMEIGKILIKDGILIFICGGIIYLLIKFVFKKR